MTGTVKFFNSSKGFGFITPDNGNDLFFHISEVKGQEPKDGDKVEFEVGQGKKGPCAINVRVKGHYAICLDSPRGYPKVMRKLVY